MTKVKFSSRQLLKIVNNDYRQITVLVVHFNGLVPQRLWVLTIGILRCKHVYKIIHQWLLSKFKIIINLLVKTQL